MNALRRYAALALSLSTIACGDDGTDGMDGTSGNPVEIACRTETCTECCNADACAEDSACTTGEDEPARLILFCDGPEDCVAGEACCASTDGASAVIAECRPTSTCEGLTAATFFCQDTEECADTEQCLPFDLAFYVSTCQSEAPDGCTPGSEIFCTCVGGTSGVKICNPDGQTFGDCVCP